MLICRGLSLCRPFICYFNYITKIKTLPFNYSFRKKHLKILDFEKSIMYNSIAWKIVIFNIGVWLSLVERLVRDQKVGCSNHLTPTKWKQVVYTICFLFYSIYLIGDSNTSRRRRTQSNLFVGTAPRITSLRPKATKNQWFLVAFFFVKNLIKVLTYSFKRCIVSFLFIW